MKERIAGTIRSLLIRRFGVDIVRYRKGFSDTAIEICDAVAPYTMTSPERVHALIDAVRYVEASRIEGSLVECGVWRGGSAMAMMLTLKKLGCEEREIFLYDTFSGMSAPADVDVSFRGDRAHERFSRSRISEDTADWCLSPLEDVRRNTLSTGYTEENIHFVEGKVEDTIPERLPEKIALLRLDTDWYESTRHELIHLFPLLQPRGVLIVDDYGHWEGARRAVDEYIAENDICILLNRIDYTGRIGIKT